MPSHFRGRPIPLVRQSRSAGTFIHLGLYIYADHSRLTTDRDSGRAEKNWASYAHWNGIRIRVWETSHYVVALMGTAYR